MFRDQAVRNLKFNSDSKPPLKAYNGVNNTRYLTNFNANRESVFNSNEPETISNF